MIFVNIFTARIGIQKKTLIRIDKHEPFEMESNIICRYVMLFFDPTGELLENVIGLATLITPLIK